MNRIQQRMTTHILTSTQIASEIASFHSPCLICGGLDFSLTHRGEWICVECDPARGLSGSVAARILLCETPSGSWEAVDRRKALMRLTERLALEEVDGTVFSHNGEDWAAWVAEDGSTCYQSLAYHNPGAVADRIRRKEVPKVW